MDEHLRHFSSQSDTLEKLPLCRGTLAQRVQVASGAHACPDHMCCTLLITQKPFLFTTIRLDDCRPLPRHLLIASHHVAQHSAPVRPEAPELAQSKPLDTVRLAVADSPPDMP
jgi:hypothetical protein